MTIPGIPNVRETWGGGGYWVNDCQWPNCGDIAGHTTRRGSGMERMYVCDRHMLAMRALPDADAFEISAARQPRAGRNVSRRHIERSDEA